MTHAEKVEHLIEDLGRRGVGKNLIAPPYLRLLWRLGFEVRPLLFQSPGQLFGSWALLTFLITFGISWLVLDEWTPKTVVMATVPGVIVGLFMASTCSWYARYLSLPVWEQYPES